MVGARSHACLLLLREILEEPIERSSHQKMKLEEFPNRERVSQAGLPKNDICIRGSEDQTLVQWNNRCGRVAIILGLNLENVHHRIHRLPCILIIQPVTCEDPQTGGLFKNDLIRGGKAYVIPLPWYV